MSIRTPKTVMQDISGGRKALYSVAPGQDFRNVAHSIYERYKDYLRADVGGAYDQALERAEKAGLIIKKPKAKHPKPEGFVPLADSGLHTMDDARRESDEAAAD
jgi:hypothetical protein